MKLGVFKDKIVISTSIVYLNTWYCSPYHCLNSQRWVYVAVRSGRYRVRVEFLVKSKYPRVWGF